MNILENVSLNHELDSFPILKDFSNQIGGDIKYVTFLY